MIWEGDTAVLDPKLIERLKAIGQARVDSKSGMTDTRWDGSKYDPQVSIEAAAAEYVGTRRLGVPFDTNIYRHGDGGTDALFRGKTVEVYRPGPRAKHAVIIAPEQKHRHCDLYVCVTGDLKSARFTVRGFVTHDELITLRPLTDFGWGPRHFVAFEDLHPISELFAGDDDD